MDVRKILADNGIYPRKLNPSGHSYSTCPKCSHTRKKKNERCLSILVDSDNLVWYCHHCGWTKGDGTRAGTPTGPVREWKEDPPARFVPEYIMQQSVDSRSRHGTAFCAWLEGIFGWPVAQAALDLYNVGRNKEGHTVFWLVDYHGRVRQPRVTAFGADGNSSDRRRRGWVPPGYQTSEGFQPCMFGEHLFMQKPGAPVVYVESEKTAVVGECVWPQAVWVSINGCSNFRRAAACPMNRGRLVFSMFDPDESGRTAEAGMRAHIGADVLCYQGLDTWPGAGKETTDGYNLADYAYNPYGGEMEIECSEALRIPPYGVPELFAAAESLADAVARLRV